MWSTTLCRIGSIHLPCTANHIEIVMELTQVFPYGSHGDSVVLLVNYRNLNQPYDTQENNENKTITKLTANNLWHFKLLFYHLHASIWSTCREVYIFLWNDGWNWVAKLNLNPWEEAGMLMRWAAYAGAGAFLRAKAGRWIENGRRGKRKLGREGQGRELKCQSTNYCVSVFVWV